MTSVLLVAASIVLAVLLGRAVRRRLGFVTEVQSVSMAPTLMPGQRLLARRYGATRPLRRGDIVAVDSAELGRPIIKRVVGLPGERLDVSADGRVQVAGHDLVEPYVVHPGGRPRRFEVPAGRLLLLGDNRACSSDARVWREPYLPVKAVLGRVVRFGSPTRLAMLNRGTNDSTARLRDLIKRRGQARDRFRDPAMPRR